MAGDSDTTSPALEPHVQTYGGVISLLKWGAVAAFAVAAMVVLLIAR